MRYNILWRGRGEYESSESCTVETFADGIIAHSAIAGSFAGMISRVEYSIEMDVHWKTLAVNIKWWQNGNLDTIQLRQNSGVWQLNGKENGKLMGCIDVDVILTPFTNTLPIRRLNLQRNQSKEISVVYCDLLKHEVRPVCQRYTCLSEKSYQYENVPNDFEATLSVNNSGFVVDYPSLFEMQHFNNVI